jgi:hypothetical protein
MTRFLSGTSFANVCSALALAVALGTGGAYAAGTIGSHDIKNKSIRSVDIKNGQVKSADLAVDAVDSSKVRADALTAQDLATGSVGSAELADAGVTGADVLDGTLTTADFAGADHTGNISLGAGAVANGHCKQFNVTIPDTRAGEAAIINTQATLQDGVTISGQRVPTDGSVTMNVCNLSGTTMDPLTNLPIRVITVG